MIRNTQESFDAKAKGEKFQKDLVALIQEVLPEHKDVIVSSPMSAHGEDIQILTPEARKAFPFSVEAKHREKGFSSVYTAYEQAARQVNAISSALSIYAVAAIQQQGHDPLIVMSADDFLELITKKDLN
tara:strand:- start:187 stop:573 length:387 start_codon:yes stop_codon:yes gene_type:complete